MRVLHLLQPWSDDRRVRVGEDPPHRGDAAVLACRAVVAGLKDHSHSVLLLGGTKSAARAAALGLDSCDRVAPPLGDASLASPGVRRYMAMRGRYDIVQCWGTGFRKLVQRAGLGEMFVCEFDFDTGGWATAGRAVDVPAWRMASHAGDRRAHRLAHHAERGGTQRALLRRSMGLADDDVALLLIADPPSSADANRFAYLLALLGVAGKRIVGVLSRSSRRVRHAKDPQRTQHMHKPLIVVDGPIVSVLPACDLGVFGVGSRFGEPPETFTFANKTLIGCTHAAGMPVVTACAAAAASEVCVANTAHPARLARAIARLVDDEAAMREARAAAGSGNVRTGRARFVETIRAGWEAARVGTTTDAASARELQGASV